MGEDVDAARFVAVARMRWHMLKNRTHSNPDPAFTPTIATRFLHPLWRESFELFLAGVGAPPDRETTTLVLVDDDLGFVPGNVAWSAPRPARFASAGTLATVDGVSRPLREWGELRDLGTKLLVARFNAGDRGAVLLRDKHEMRTGHAPRQERPPERD